MKNDISYCKNDNKMRLKLSAQSHNHVPSKSKESSA